MEKEEEDRSNENVFYFNDGTRRIDFVLTYLNDHHERTDKRTYFENYLKYLKETFGLDIEEGESDRSVNNEEGESSVDNDQVYYIKIHAPNEILCNSAEDLKMKKPTKLNDINIKTWYEDSVIWYFLQRVDPFKLNHPQTRQSKKYFVAHFYKSRYTEFVNHDNPDLFFPPTERGRLVYYLLEEARFGDRVTDIGIEQLIDKGVFLDAYPLHDGPTLKCVKNKPGNDRQRLQKDWALLRCLFKYQPIDAVREYFGEKIALYFSWLGFYTMFLIPAAFLGILCFIYGAVSAMTSPEVLESCSDPPGRNGSGHLFYMCPLCDKHCPYFLLKENCVYAKVSNYFDNEATPVFAVFMSVWATTFLEFWKRRQISLAHEWHSTGFVRNEEKVRPEYAATNPILKRNPVTHKHEPRMPKGVKIRKMMGTVGVVLFFVLLVMAAVVGVVLFRAAFSFALLSSANTTIHLETKLIVMITAGLFNLIAINLLRVVYIRVAVVLTEWENPRTRTNYEDSFTVKMFLFQFFNTYSSLIYVAFLKTNDVTGSPGNYNRFTKSRFRLDGCSAQGCFLDLTVQLVIINVGQQFIDNLLETTIPSVLKWWRKRHANKKIDDVIESGDAHQPQWVGDFQCEMQTKFSLFWEYLEIVLQYGFVTMFVTGFPLAPFFALINNIFEIRVDAHNYVYNCRRPVAQRAEDIGAWYGILVTLTSVSVLMNACVLAFTSKLIPTLVYKHTASGNHTMHGYVNWSLSYFNVKDFTDESRPSNETIGGIPLQDQCRYPGFHDPTHPYKRNITYWMILSARLAYVLCFVVFVMFVSWAISYLIPDVPKSLEVTIKREKFLSAQADKDHNKRLVIQKPVPSGSPSGTELKITDIDGNWTQSTSLYSL